MSGLIFKINILLYKKLAMKITENNQTQPLYVSMNLSTVGIARVFNTFNFLGF